jgi:hypothetical protein
MSGLEAISEAGDRLATLKALRDRLAAAIDNSSGAVGIAARDRVHAIIVRP